MTTNEIKTLLGVSLLMGIIYQPKMHMYWSKDALYSTAIFSRCPFSIFYRDQNIKIEIKILEKPNTFDFSLNHRRITTQ